MTRPQTTCVLFLALAAALLLAANQVGQPQGWSLAGVYGYWTGRVLIEAALFMAFADLFSRLPVLRPRPVLTSACAALVSLVPFVLSITALDLILGLPELDPSMQMAAPTGASISAAANGSTHVTSFLRELVYLSDNHLALCLLLSAPRVLPALFDWSAPAAKDQLAAFMPAQPTSAHENRSPATASTPGETDGSKGYARHLDQPLSEDLLRVEAQEHYVRLVGQTDSRMLLYRFNDIVAELPPEAGMQVHRSHWVAFAAMDAVSREGGRLFLKLTDGSKIPVSRKYSGAVRDRFPEERGNAKKAVI